MYPAKNTRESCCFPAALYRVRTPKKSGENTLSLFVSERLKRVDFRSTHSGKNPRNKPEKKDEDDDRNDECRGKLHEIHTDDTVFLCQEIHAGIDTLRPTIPEKQPERSPEKTDQKSLKNEHLENVRSLRPKRLQDTDFLRTLKKGNAQRIEHTHRRNGHDDDAENDQDSADDGEKGVDIRDRINDALRHESGLFDLQSD